MATTTPNYGLIKPAETDYYAVSVQNENMDTLEAALTKQDRSLESHDFNLKQHAASLAKHEEALGAHGAALAKQEETLGAHSAALAGKAALDPETGKVRAEQLPAIDVSGQIAAHNADAAAHAGVLAGKAPAGIISDTIIVASAAEMEGKLTALYANMADSTVKHVMIQCTEVFPHPFGGGNTVAVVRKVNLLYGTVSAIQYRAHGAMEWSRSVVGGVWQPWEWVNPPMERGVEYRTTERYLGKPVYKKLIDCGRAPAARKKSVATGLGGTSRMIGYHAGWGYNALPYTEPAGTLYIEAVNLDGVSIVSTYDWSSTITPIYLECIYYKITD